MIKNIKTIAQVYSANTQTMKAWALFSNFSEINQLEIGFIVKTWGWLHEDWIALSTG